MSSSKRTFKSKMVQLTSMIYDCSGKQKIPLIKITLFIRLRNSKFILFFLLLSQLEMLIARILRPQHS